MRRTSTAPMLSLSRGGIREGSGGEEKSKVFPAGASSVAALLGAVLAALVFSIPAFAQDGKAMVRVAHLSPDAPNVDVDVNDEPVGALSGISFGTVSPYLSLPAGTQNVKVYAADDASEPLIQADLDLQGGEAYTLGAVGLVEDGSLAAQIYEDDKSLPAEGKARLRVVHAAPDVASVDVAPGRGGEALFADLGFPNATSYEEVPSGTYTLEARAAGTDLPAFSIPEPPSPPAWCTPPSWSGWRKRERCGRSSPAMREPPTERGGRRSGRGRGQRAHRFHAGDGRGLTGAVAVRRGLSRRRPERHVPPRIPKPGSELPANGRLDSWSLPARAALPKSCAPESREAVYCQ